MTVLALELLLDLPVVAGKHVGYRKALTRVRNADHPAGLPSRQLATERLLFLDALQRYCQDKDGDGTLDATTERLVGIEFDSPLTLQAMVQRYDEVLGRWREAISSDYATAERLAEELRRDIGPYTRDLVAFLMADYGVFDRRLRRTTATRNGAYTVLLMHGFHDKVGRWPESLAEMVRGEPQGIADDPFSVGDLIYRFDNEGPLLYSVGLNGTDDGGRSPARDGKPWSNEGDHVFWPRSGPVR